MFHVARTDDVAEAAMKVRQSIGPNQILTGVGFSMVSKILSRCQRKGSDWTLQCRFLS